MSPTLDVNTTIFVILVKTHCALPNPQCCQSCHLPNNPNFTHLRQHSYHIECYYVEYAKLYSNNRWATDNLKVSWMTTLINSFIKNYLNQSNHDDIKCRVALVTIFSVVKRKFIEQRQSTQCSS